MKTLEERFWSRVKKRDNGCWEWGGFIRPDGYGHVRVGKSTMLCHRFVVRDCIPEGLDVLHKCDNRRCVNPDHLFFGTHDDNMKDHVRKNRHALKDGEDHPFSKLTEDQVRIIRARPRRYGVVKQLCAAFGISRPTLYAACLGYSWDHLPPPTDEDRKKALAFVDSLP